MIYLLVILLLALLLLGWQARRLWQRNKQLQERIRTIQRDEQHEAIDLQDDLLIRDGLFGIIEDALLVVDTPHQQIVLANASAHALFGDQLAGETVIAATRNYELDQLILQAQQDELNDHRAGRILEILQRQMRVRIAPIQVGHQMYYGISLRDETEVLRLGRARREMVANISHELRHPITNIVLLTDTLLSGTIHKKKGRRKMIKDIRREVDELAHLVNEMRDLSLIESGQMPVRLMPTLLIDVIDISVASLENLAESKSQTIEVNIAESITVLADPPKLQRVTKNIIHNAIKFAPENGHIWIKALLEAEEAVVSIRNDGPSIPNEDLPRLFERFFQVDRARSDGTGLGLAIARHIVRSHTGRIWAVNNPGSEGVTFYFTLPRADIDLSEHSFEPETEDTGHASL